MAATQLNVSDHMSLQEVSYLTSKIQNSLANLQLAPAENKAKTKSQRTKGKSGDDSRTSVGTSYSIPADAERSASDVHVTFQDEAETTRPKTPSLIPPLPQDFFTPRTEQTARTGGDLNEEEEEEEEEEPEQETKKKKKPKKTKRSTREEYSTSEDEDEEEVAQSQQGKKRVSKKASKSQGSQAKPKIKYSKADLVVKTEFKVMKNGTYSGKVYEKDENGKRTGRIKHTIFSSGNPKSTTNVGSKDKTSQFGF